MSDRRQAFHTPDNPTGATVVRMIVAPVEFIRLVGGALSELTNPDNWDEVGTLTAIEAAEAGIEIMDFFYGQPFIGAVMAFAINALPPGWSELNGQTLDGELYPELFALVPSEWINFFDDIVLPDLTGKFVAGAGSFYPIGYSDGEEEVTLDLSQIPSHAHTYTPPSINPDVEGPGVPDIGATVIGPSAVTGTAGSGLPHNNMPPYITMRWAIFTGRSYV
jgi:microcystin-dependent protein